MNLKANFFASVYQREQVRTDACFGINDAFEESENNDKGMAYTTIDGTREGWNAIVENPDCKDVTLTPLDHNIIIHPTPSETYSLCDCMLYNKEWIAFVELKIKGSGDSWIQKMISQLQSTIDLFCANHDYHNYRFRVAYAANKKHPSFHYSHRIQMNEFRNKTHFRLLITNKIVVK